jgi:signal peptidase I
MAPISEPFAIRWGFRVAVLLVCLNLVTAFWSPVEGLLFALICASFAWGIWRKQAWATIAAIGYQLIPLTELGSPANWPEGLIGEVLFLVLIHNLFALAFLLAAVALWRERSSRSAWVWMSLLAVFLIGVVSLKAFRTPVPSMEETLLVGDTVVVEHASWYLGRAPQNGDIIVFLYPMDRSKAFFKRVVGVPGDRLRIEGKQLYRNGNPVVEDYAVFKGRPVDDERFPPPAGAAPLGLTATARTYSLLISRAARWWFLRGITLSSETTETTATTAGTGDLFLVAISSALPC